MLGKGRGVSTIQLQRIVDKMASIFTFETEPSRISSPWPSVSSSGPNESPREGKSTLAGIKIPRIEVLVGCGISKLEAEPQEGSTEYKLHLLLRPRRNFSFTSTVQAISGSHLSTSQVNRSHSEADVKQATPTSVLAPSSQSRQNRLQHLTTQLLWRLQQSSPYHSSSKSSLVLPILPEAVVERSASKGPFPLIPGLEGSSGALYEIGVSDDGAFVGLARDELEESLTVLRAMAFSLGCNIEVLRMIIVGDCQWTEENKPMAKFPDRLRKEKLFVAEVLVAPNLDPQGGTSNRATLSANSGSLKNAKAEMEDSGNSTSEPEGEQLRVSLTGSTTSGKSSLLGTLSTSTLDNGRGKSRLSLLKHRHEIVSGVTSSLAQELFGYQGMVSTTSGFCTNVINYASGNVSSWDDIHNASESGRLVFVTDSAGHPRYRRTTVRGLVSWAPHWTLCCIGADDQEDSSGKVGATASATEVLGSAGIGTDLSKAHLDLCLKMDLPLVIVITKLDLATKTGLRETLARTLTILKSAGRKPAVLSSSFSNEKTDNQRQSIAKDDEGVVRRVIASVPPGELRSLVPIVLTSAVNGCGIGKLHALLRELPLTTADFATNSVSHFPDEAIPRTLFHVDEVFVIPPSDSARKRNAATSSTILSGYVRYGSIHVGDYMLVGPCVSDDVRNVEDIPDLQRARSYPGSSRESPSVSTLAHNSQVPTSSKLLSTKDQEGNSRKGIQTWQAIRITSLRNLRLPVRTLSVGQVGTIGITLHSSASSATVVSSISDLYLRRGMVLLPTLKHTSNGPPLAYTRVTAVFQEASLPAWPGVLVVVYIASIRASAKIIEVRALETDPTTHEVFQFDDDDSDSGAIATSESIGGNQHTEITFEFATSQEWFEIGGQILVTPGGGLSLTGQLEQKDVGNAGLDGYVGKISQAAVC